MKTLLLLACTSFMSYTFSQTTTPENEKNTTPKPKNEASQEKISKENKLNLKLIQRPEKSNSQRTTPAVTIVKKETEIKEEK